MCMLSSEFLFSCKSLRRCSLQVRRGRVRLQLSDSSGQQLLQSVRTQSSSTVCTEEIWICIRRWPTIKRIRSSVWISVLRYNDMNPSPNRLSDGSEAWPRERGGTEWSEKNSRGEREMIILGISVISCLLFYSRPFMWFGFRSLEIKPRPPRVKPCSHRRLPQQSPSRRGWWRSSRDGRRRLYRKTE